MIKVLLADDQALIRGAMGALLDLEPDIEVTAQAGRGGEVAAAARKSGTDVCLLDIQVPGVDGVETARQVRDQLLEVWVMMVTTFGRPDYLRRAPDAGAIGFVIKTTPATRLTKVVWRARAGFRTVDPQPANDLLLSSPSLLTARGQEVLYLARDGELVAKLVRKLFLPPGTVRNHLSGAIGKTNAVSQVEAARIATECGWL